MYFFMPHASEFINHKFSIYSNIFTRFNMYFIYSQQINLNVDCALDTSPNPRLPLPPPEGATLGVSVPMI